MDRLKDKQQTKESIKETNKVQCKVQIIQQAQWFPAQKTIMSWYICKKGVMVIKEVEKS